MLITVEEFSLYTKQQGNAAAQGMYTQYIESAQQVLENYTGYELEENIRTDVLEGSGTDFIQLGSKPVNSVTEIVIDGVTYTGEFEAINEFLYLLDGVTKFTAGKRITVKYGSGYTAENVPGLIKQTILRIASLMSEESGQNIGVTSKSFDSTNRVFISYANYDKYLVPCARYKLL